MDSKILVGNLSTAVDESQIKALFLEAGGTIVSVVIPRNEKAGNSRGYAFVEMGTRLEAEKAIEVLKGCELAGRALSFELTEKEAAKKGKWYKFGAV